MTGIVICTRVKSSRIPGKPLREVAGKPLIEHLITRVRKTGLPIVLATPERDAASYWRFLDYAEVMSGWDDDPMCRMYQAAVKNGFTEVVRITHDKVFVEPHLILRALDDFKKTGADYLFSSDFTDGSAFEIISTECLKKCVSKYKNIEYISYAAKEMADKVLKWTVPQIYQSKYRFLVDYPEDLALMEAILLNNDRSALVHAIEYMENNPWACSINALPWVTVYTCGYNAKEHIRKCFDSVVNQSIFNMCEYILVDDCSTDNTYEAMLSLSAGRDRVRVVRNQKNKGLASSSNVALSQAKGQYIIRMDADDYFADENALIRMLEFARSYKTEITYPSYFDGSRDKVVGGEVNHHPAGALFSTRALNYVKFTEGLRGHDGLDLYLRAKDTLSIGYYDRPSFFYTHRDGSLSRSNHTERNRIKEEIINAAQRSI